MNRIVLDYPKYQTFFNNCLREWYYQYGRGTNFYYANPPGILFTRLRSTKNVKDYHVLEDMSQWYFKANEIDQYSSNLPLNNYIKFKNNSDTYFTNYFINFGGKILSTLHIGYDSWYSRIIARASENSFNVAFCNSYDVAFNTFYNYSIYKQLLNNRIIESIHDVLVPWGCVVLVTSKADINEKIRSFFPAKNGDSLWTDSANTGYNLLNFEDSTYNRIINSIKATHNSQNSDNCKLYSNLDNCDITTNDSNIINRNESLNKIFISCFYKLKNPKPNNRLKKSVYTK
ncbi:hypothetical protein MACJ_003440 [Theileria orientalis]|uniref:Uncharacterized protein n=1 Tax=Theileria orientalis TaxID=68886 RepID=A0A976SKB2_THEOR|nr:hypothetical protein MACJ_003440 [Theileria orientalis]